MLVWKLDTLKKKWKKKRTCDNLFHFIIWDQNFERKKTLSGLLVWWFHSVVNYTNSILLLQAKEGSRVRAFQTEIRGLGWDNMKCWEGHLFEHEIQIKTKKYWELEVEIQARELIGVLIPWWLDIDKFCCFQICHEPIHWCPSIYLFVCLPCLDIVFRFHYRV
jgi:hypothetical protein